MSNLLAFLEYMNFNKQKVDIFLKSIERAGPKGQLISKADWHAIDSPKKRTDKFVLLAFLLFKGNKSNSSVRFLGESKARQSAFRFYLCVICRQAGEIFSKL